MFVMSASLSCSLESYEVLGKHYDKASMCMYSQERMFPCISLALFQKNLLSESVCMNRPHMEDVEC